MKGLAIALWFVAIVLLVSVFRMEAVEAPRPEVAVSANRGLLAIAPPTISSPVPVAPRKEVVALAVPAGCARLGIFPSQDWAERVAIILTDARKDKMPASLQALPVAEELAASPWRVRRVGRGAYYLQFDGWSLDELATRMTLQRELLRKLLSITAIPEAC